jgi:hypothetical protein
MVIALVRTGQIVHFPLTNSRVYYYGCSVYGTTEPITRIRDGRKW